MLTVTLTKGLPASGKSTWAKAQIAEDPGVYKRINKDDMRSMFDLSRWSKKNEKFVLAMRDQMILAALEEGWHVIVDDTNLHEKHEKRIRELVKGKATVEIQDFTDVPIKTCIERDLKRVASVGEKVIRDMAKRFLPRPEIEEVQYVEGLPHAIIVDLDGTLVRIGDRSPFDASDQSTDTLNKNVARIVDRCRADGVKIFLVTGRPNKYRDATVEWLEAHGVQYDGLYMRPTGDRREDTTIKTEGWKRNFAWRYNIDFILEDRSRVVAAYRELGLPVWQVAEGNY